MVLVEEDVKRRYPFGLCGLLGEIKGDSERGLDSTKVKKRISLRMRYTLTFSCATNAAATLSRR